MLTPVHENLPEAMNVSLEQEIDMLRCLCDHPRVRSQTRNSGGQAVRLRIVMRHAFARQLRGPRLQGQLLAWLESIAEVVNEVAIGTPDAGEVGFAIRQTRGFALGRSVL